MSVQTALAPGPRNIQSRAAAHKSRHTAGAMRTRKTRSTGWFTESGHVGQPSSKTKALRVAGRLRLQAERRNGIVWISSVKTIFGVGIIKLEG